MSSEFDFKPILLQQIPYKAIRTTVDHSSSTQQKLAKCIVEIKSLLSGHYLERFLIDYFKDAREYDDELMELSLTANALPSHNQLHFLIDEDYISIASSNYMVTNGTTGAHVWEAGVALGEYLALNRHSVQGKRVIELGCGTGFCGVVASRVGARSVTVTDLAVVLDTCTKQNISESIKMMDLDWRYPEAVDFSAFDVLMASDVVFDPEIVVCLVELLAHAKSANVNVIICQKVRNPSTFELLINKLQAAGITPEVTDVSPCYMFYYNHTDIKLLTF